MQSGLPAPAACVAPDPGGTLPSRPSRFRLQPDDRAEAARRRRMQRDLEAAIAAESFVLRFQPRLSLASGTIVAAEARIGWPHRKQGLLSDAAFLPFAEQTGQSLRLGGWALRAACGRAASRGWPDGVTVSVSVGARQIAEGVVLRQLAEALEQSGLPPEQLEIQLTESLLADISLDTLLTLSAIRDLGVGLALDDFGTGFSSLSTLKRLPLTAMKLGHGLLRDLPFDREDAAIVRAVIVAGHALGLAIVADGIETEAQRGFLAAAGCDQAQGPLFGQALTDMPLRTG